MGGKKEKISQRIATKQIQMLKRKRAFTQHIKLKEILDSRQPNELS